MKKKPLKYIGLDFSTGKAIIVRSISKIPKKFDVIEGPEEQNIQILKDHKAVEGEWFKMRARMIIGLQQLF